ncbi:hypothetical protein CIRG_08393 [Coccidioides immitis RMSCC 2394]|uniref:Uncharacterized protein n=1 Tax=Coccidioides immitis RMSCC 2394 TaxID=404692 RepID=A0A0J7BEY2_COCIT|nr:hypothetical protein CIRG_08393 [Coccidioides immitis RMSCC 2394]
MTVGRGVSAGWAGVLFAHREKSLFGEKSMRGEKDVTFVVSQTRSLGGTEEGSRGKWEEKREGKWDLCRHGAEGAEPRDRIIYLSDHVDCHSLLVSSHTLPPDDTSQSKLHRPVFPSALSLCLPRNRIADRPGEPEREPSTAVVHPSVDGKLLAWGTTPISPLFALRSSSSLNSHLAG